MGFVEDFAVQDDARAVAARGRDLGQRRLDGHDDRGLDAGDRRGHGHALGVVAGRSGDDASRAGLGGEGQDAVQRAAQLVRARALQVLVLEPDPTAAQLGERAGFPARGQVDAVGNALRGSLDVRRGLSSMWVEVVRMAWAGPSVWRRP